MADRKALILDMLEKGFSPLTIAQVLVVGAEEVEEVCRQRTPSDGQRTTGDHSTEQGEHGKDKSL